MAILLDLRRPRGKPARESFFLKSMLVATALFLCALVMANQEFYMSAPDHSLSETKMTLRVAAK
jgi:hypothetical protein